MTSFMLKVGPLDTAYLSSAYSTGASWTDANTYSGIVEQLGDPTSEVVLSASNPASTVQSAITIGERFWVLPDHHLVTNRVLADCD